MAITINTQVFELESQDVNSTTFAKTGATLAEPYRIKRTRTLPGNAKNAVLRGSSRVTRTYLDANGEARSLVFNVSSSVPVSCPADVLADFESDCEAYMAQQATSDVLFKGKVY